MSQENEKLHLVINGVIPSKKNSKKVIPDWKHRRVRLITSPEVQNWEKVVQSGVMGMGKIDGPVKMEIVIYNPDLRKRDLDNQLCSINDAIKGVLFEEDDGKVLQDIHIRWGGVDKNNPRAEITISPLTV